MLHSLTDILILTHLWVTSMQRPISWQSQERDYFSSQFGRKKKSPLKRLLGTQEGQAGAQPRVPGGVPGVRSRAQA